MERVATAQFYSKRLLEKQLDEIELKQRQAEGRRLRQIRDLGVDLNRIHKTSPDLDHEFYDVSNRSQGCRRGSLPPLDSRGEFPSYLEVARAPRSRRRLSCIAAIPAAFPDTPSLAEATGYTQGRQRSSSFRQLPPIQIENGPGAAASSGDIITAEESNLNPDSTPCYNNNFTDQNLLTDNEPFLDSQRMLSQAGQTSPSCDVAPETERQAIFGHTSRNFRRASEPILENFWIRHMQDLTLGEVPAFQFSGSEECHELRKSILKNLPPDIVAEGEEDEGVEDGNNNPRHDDKAVSPAECPGKIDASHELHDDLELSSEHHQRHPLSSILESEPDGDFSLSKNRHINTTDSNEEIQRRNRIRKQQEKKYAKVPQHRRKSDGDVLVLDQTGKLLLANKHLRGRYGRGAPPGTGRMRYSLPPKEEENQTDVWQGLRDCRYLRGQDLPQINEPEEVVNFVFGHRSKE